MRAIYQSLNECSHSLLPWEVTLSFGILGCTIDHALQWFWKFRKERYWGLADEATIRMLCLGWCPRDVAAVSEVMSEIPAYCTSFMAPSFLSQDHRRCSPAMCYSNQISEQTYITKHRMPECRCRHLSSVQADIYRILDEGKIPVVQLTPRLQPDGVRDFELEIKKGTSLIYSYVAISHV